MSVPEEIRYDEGGLVPVVTQDADTGEVLMLAYASREAVEKTVETGEAHYYSRSRGELWRKGETSGNTQKVIEVRLDCDGDALLYRVEPAGPACHTGEKSCFFTTLAGSDGEAPNLGRTLTRLAGTISGRHQEMPEGSYTAKLFERGAGYTAQKVGEEAVRHPELVSRRDHQPGLTPAGPHAAVLVGRALQQEDVLLVRELEGG